MILTGPIGALLGVAFGILLARRWDLSYALLSMWGAVAGVLWMHLVGHLESFARARFPERGPASTILAHVGADVVGGAVMGGLFAVVLGTDAAASLAAGASLLLAYSFVATRLLWGNVVDDLVGLLSGQVGRARAPDYSYEASLAARGLVDEALRRYEQASLARPGDTRPLLLAAETLRDNGRYEEAVDRYRRALAVPSVDSRRAAILTRHIWEMCATRLDRPGDAIDDLRSLVERYPDEPAAEWARRELEEAGEAEGV